MAYRVDIIYCITYREQAAEVQAKEVVNAFDEAGKSHGHWGAVIISVSGNGVYRWNEGDIHLFRASPLEK